MAKKTPADLRFDAIRSVTEMALNADNGYMPYPNITTNELIRTMSDMLKLGRTERWHLAISRWQNMVKECDDFEPHSEEWNRHMHWAIVQGNVYAGYAAY